MAADTETIEDRLEAMEAFIRRYETTQNQFGDVLEAIFDAVCAHGDAALLKKLQAILTDFRVTHGAALDTRASRLELSALSSMSELSVH